MKLLKFLKLTLLWLSFTTAYAQIGVNTTNPENSSILDLVSNNKGFLPPRLTTAERNAIANPAEGLIIYNKSANTKCLQVYRNVTNGSGWFDMCCTDAVSQLANFSAAGVLFSPGKFFAGPNGTGGSIADGEEVGSIGPVDLSAFGAQYPSAGYFNQFDGTFESGFTVTQTTLNNTVNNYTASKKKKKNGDFTSASTDETDDLRLDLSGVTTGVYTGDFTLTVVARYNAIPSGEFKSFFAVGATNTSPGSFQLDNTTAGRYNVILNEIIRLSGDAVPSTQAVPVDDKFHLYNVIYRANVNGNPQVTFYIDGLLQTETNTNRDLRISGLIRLLNNRDGDQSVNGSISYFGLDPVAKTQAEITSLSKSIACLFDEL